MDIRSPRPARPVLVAISVAALALGLSACGESTIKTSEIESTITKQFAAQGVKLTDVTCKDGAKAEAGAPVSCTALNPSQTKLILKGTVTSVKDDRASFRVVATSGVAKGPTVAAEALKLLESKYDQKAKSLVCPADVPIPTTPSVVCTLTTGDGKRYDTTLKIDAKSRIDVRVADKAKS